MNYRLLLVAFPLLFLTPGCQNPEEPPGFSSGDKAAEIVGEDVMKGTPIKLSQYRGKVVLVDFWATWCGYCVNELPQERDMFRQFDGRPFAILGVSRDRTKQDLVNFLEREKLPWPNVLDASGNICDQWGVSGFPTFVLIDHKGAIVKRWVGGGQIDQIRKAVDEAVRNAEKAGG